MPFSRLPLLVAAPLLCLAACGLLVSEPSPPSVEEVMRARAADANDWALLETAWLSIQKTPADALQILASMRAEHPESVRLAVFEQDIQLRMLDLAQVRALAEAHYREQGGGALQAFLYARVAESPEHRDALLTEALDSNEHLVEARVMQLATAAFAGDTEVLRELLLVLQDHPGAAGAWRLLGTLAPLFDRHDLAYRAAATEPWSPFDSVERATFAFAQHALADGFPDFALQRSYELPPGTSQTINLQAAALAALGQAHVALAVLDDFLEQHPDDLVTVFNRGLLLREYLGRAAEAEVELKRFLQLEEAQGGADLMRRMQAEYWLGRGAQQ